MRILIVGMPFSIHIVRWISLIDKKEHEVHFFSSFYYAKPHAALSDVIFHDYPDNFADRLKGKSTYRTFSNKKRPIDSSFFWKWMEKGSRFLKYRKDHLACLAQTIESIRPDVVHTMESQHAGYLMSEYVQSNQGPKPFWIHTTFGIDLDYFQYFPEHKKKLEKMFTGIDLYLAEGDRDINLARGLGFKGRVQKFPSAGGGYDLGKFSGNHGLAPSKRKLILVKGYQDSVRRGLSAIRSLVLCKDVLQHFDVVVYSCANEVKDYIQYINSKEGMNIGMYESTGYDEWLKTLSNARISVTCNLSDGIPSSLFESMLMGVFPVQSYATCADEWIEHGKTGLFIPPEDPEVIAAAIRQALTDDSLVDGAAPLNYEKVASALSSDKVQTDVRNLYTQAVNS
ncbi:MAG: glycosyltransferase family 4 protein [Bacteroidetes bacterium]|nr:glycosyltransferase family 4 protein [Bacteroidota bacterium]